MEAAASSATAARRAGAPARGTPSSASRSAPARRGRSTPSPRPAGGRRAACPRSRRTAAGTRGGRSRSGRPRRCRRTPRCRSCASCAAGPRPSSRSVRIDLLAVEVEPARDLLPVDLHVLLRAEAALLDRGAVLAVQLAEVQVEVARRARQADRHVHEAERERSVPERARHAQDPFPRLACRAASRSEGSSPGLGLVRLGSPRPWPCARSAPARPRGRCPRSRSGRTCGGATRPARRPSRPRACSVALPGVLHVQVVGLDDLVVEAHRVQREHAVERRARRRGTRGCGR